MHLLEGNWPTEALLAQIAVSKHSEHFALNRQAVVMARLGWPIERSVLPPAGCADRRGREGGEHSGGGDWSDPTKAASAGGRTKPEGPTKEPAGEPAGRAQLSRRGQTSAVSQRVSPQEGAAFAPRANERG